jgi:hypothetical protein
LQLLKRTVRMQRSFLARQRRECTCADISMRHVMLGCCTLNSNKIKPCMPACLHSQCFFSTFLRSQAS